ncbi:hypothetical protein [uncultured Paraglaciecola sp.]|uniref:hypothetical protein n=1 Tax=uncultured Paraglaciecola sp. TaxID=1765024 RepID=UPI0026157662|nr:hypothetical protein [uncultured Paraglaciecola sp.]
MLFFQLFLLMGYLYAYTLTKVFKVKSQVVVHLTCLLLSLMFLPYNVADMHQDVMLEQPTWAVLKVLFLGLGCPYFILSANTPLLQHWFTRESQGSQPYRLYAVSNVGSFLALVSYPLFIEPFLTLESQLKLWSAFYWLFVLLVGWIFYVVVKQKNSKLESIANQISHSKVGCLRVFLWFTFSALGVVLLVSTTNALTQNIPPVPFLWIVPLALYLLTYVLAFSQLGFYNRVVWLPLFMLLTFVALLIYFIGGQFDILTQLFLYLVILFSGCMICHGELNALKPHQGNTSLFYLVLAVGGVFGSFLVSIVAKNLFDDFLEFPLAIFSVLVLTAMALWWPPKDKAVTENMDDNAASHSQHSKLTLGIFAVAVVWLLAFMLLNKQYQQYDIVQGRNFYGILAVKDITQGQLNERRLIDGTTSHGSQSLIVSQAAIPKSYYRPETGVQLVIAALSKERKLQVGIIGLGVGALAAYGQAGDHYTFYELNPLVSDYAAHYFSYLSDALAEVDVKLGDARVSLQSELDSGQQNAFDLLIIDAFSGDLIPTHLMTQEAFLLYQQHIAKQGTIALHISNRHLSLLPVILHHSENLGMQVMLFETPGGDYEHDAQWVVLTNNSRLTESEELRKKQTVIIQQQYKKVIWTDDYSSLLPILKVLN